MTDVRSLSSNQPETLSKNVDTEKRLIDFSSTIADPAFLDTPHSGADSKLTLIQLEAEVEVKRDTGTMSMRNGSGDSSCYEQDEQNKVRSELDLGSRQCRPERWRCL